MRRGIWAGVLGFLACSEAPDDTGDMDSSDTAVAESSVHQAIFVVHLEPGALPRDPETGLPHTARAEAYFETLLSLVELADEQDHKLTLLFTPQWAHYVSLPVCTLPSQGEEAYTYQGSIPADCAELIHQIEAHGHEIGLHHHPLGAPAPWDGFTSEESWEADRNSDAENEVYFADGGGPSGPDPFHLGDLNQMMDWVSAVSSTGSVQTATTEELHSDIRFSMAGGPASYVSLEEPGDLVSRPCVADYEDHSVWELRMRLFTSASAHETVLGGELPLALQDLESADSDAAVLAFVTHALNVEEEGLVAYEQLFSSLSEEGIALQSTASVMAGFPLTATSAAEADPVWACPS